MDDERHNYYNGEVFDMMKLNDQNDQLTFILMSLDIDLINTVEHDLSSVNITETMNFKIVQDSCKNVSLSHSSHSPSPPLLSAHK